MSGMISGEEFLNRVIGSGLLSSDEVLAALDEFGAVNEVAGARDLARVLVESGQLTPFQADALIEGRLSQLFIGNYAILSRLGSGAMGTVFKARHRRMNRVVALKVFSGDSTGTSTLSLRFQREVETIARLNHPNIVMAHDAGECEGRLYLVMEYVDGRDLGVEVARNGPLSPADAIECVLQAARGLDCAHGRGIVHRDVKPANLLRDTSGVVKVADLGLAHLSDSDAAGVNASLTQAGNLLGTANYIAPEQALDSANIDLRVDIYSLGCTLYFLLMGRPLYTAGSLMALLLKHRDAPIPSLQESRADVPGELDELYMRMVAKSPGDRFATMADVVEALERLKTTVALFDVRSGGGESLPRRVSPTELTMAADAAAPVTDSGEFRMSLPLTHVDEAPSPSDVRRVSDLKVVLVEPSRFQARIAQQYLRQLHIEHVVAAGSGRQALELTKREKANVVLSSMHLGDMTGLELVEALRNDPDCTDVGFVLASSDLDSVETRRFQEAPCPVLLPKPIDVRRLAQALAQATGRVVEEILG